MNKTVLLVEDDDLIRGSLARVLKAREINVIEAENGKDGLSKALSENVDLVVTDIIMPEVDGLSMLASLREDKKGKQIPAIILSSDEEPESLNKAIEAGVTVYLSKANLDAEAIANQIVIAVGA